jgi:undecaprenyl diphosphate synthase
MEESDTAANDSKRMDVPQHIAIIMDGNGRWAEARSQPRHAGHRAGVKSVRKTVESAAKRGVRYLTLFAFSSENWRRPAAEVRKLMRLFVDALRREVDDLHRNNVKLQFIGAREQLDTKLLDRIAAAEKRTAKNSGLHLIVAVAYGGRWDIAQAARRIGERAVAGEIDPADIGEDTLAAELQLADVPDPDLLIRTGGEHRISNFLLWNLAYAELWFCDVFWPDFRQREFDQALDFYAQRQRRRGHTGDQLEAAKC